MNTSRKWGDIYPEAGDFNTDILQIQQFATLREKSQKWAQDLRLLSPMEQATTESLSSKVLENEEELSCPRCQDYPRFNSLQPDLAPVTKFRLTDPGELRGCDHYIAVSYCWRQPRGSDTSKVADSPYTIYTKMSGTEYQHRPNRAPKAILDRAVRYASYYGLRFIWIDQECIDQEDRLDQEVGIQSMDMVYERSLAPIGILQTRIESQYQVDILEKLYDFEDLNKDEVREAIKLLGAISEDPWFTRAWILQESTSAGENMDLLVQCDSSFTVRDTWDDTPGEVELQFDTLVGMVLTVALQTSRYFSFAGTSMPELMDNVFERLANPTGERIIVDVEEDEIDRIIDENIDYVKNDIDEGAILINEIQGALNRLLLHTPTDFVSLRKPTYRISCNAASASIYLRKCFNSKAADRLAILANMCQYPIRIDTTKIHGSSFPLETCLLTQAILNGDLSILSGQKNHVWDQGSDTQRRNCFSWLPPETTTMNDSALESWPEGVHPFRLSHHVITSRGLSLQGFHWRIDQRIDVSDLKARYVPLFHKLSRVELGKWDALVDNYREIVDSYYQTTSDDARWARLKSLWSRGPDNPQDLSKWEDEDILEKICCEIVWSVLQRLLGRGLAALADAIWHSVRRKCFLTKSPLTRPELARNDREAHRMPVADMGKGYGEELPDTFAEVMHREHEMDGLMAVRTVDPRSGGNGHPVTFLNPWFIERVLDKGCFYYGNLVGGTESDQRFAVFDIDKPGEVLLPYSTGMDEFGEDPGDRLPTLRYERIAWKVKQDGVVRSDDHTAGQIEMKNFTCEGMVAGFWQLGDLAPERYNLS